MNRNLEIAYAEIDKILELMDRSYVEKIPQKLRALFSEKKDMSYIPTIDGLKELYQYELRRETIIILSILNVNYWVTDEEDRKLILRNFENNQEVPENIFSEDYLYKKYKDANTELIEYKKPNLLVVILQSIRNIFKR